MKTTHAVFFFAVGSAFVLGACGSGPKGGGTTDGTLVDLYTCTATGAQVWVPQGNGELLNPQSGKCLDDPDGIATPPGGPPIQLQIWDCINNDLNQIWSSPAF